MSRNVAAEKLSRRQWAAIEQLAAGATMVSVSEQLGINRRTLQRWCRDADFAAALQAERRRIHRQSMERIQALASDAVDRLEGLLSSGNREVELKAARIIIEAGRRWTREAEVLDRLAELEKRYDT